MPATRFDRKTQSSFLMHLKHAIQTRDSTSSLAGNAGKSSVMQESDREHADSLLGAWKRIVEPVVTGFCPISERGGIERTIATRVHFDP
jgi:hypothetical protein